MLIASPTKISRSYIIIGLFLIMMVVFISLKKDYMKRRELESVQVNSVHYSRLFLPPIKKISKPRHTSYSARRRSISWRRPCFCRRSFLHLTDFSYFSSIILRVHSRQSSWRASWICRTRRPSQCVGLSAESSSWWALLLLILWACCMLQVYGVIMGLNTFCNPILK